MMNFPVLIRYLFPAFLLLAAASAAEARNMYRYHNDEGHLVVDFQVPVEYVAGGYEVVSPEGVVVRVVPRQLTEEEKRDQDAQAKLDARTRAEEERLRKWDESLLLRYSTVEDIASAQERALQNLRIRVSILKSNKRSLKLQVESYQSQAADMERRGQQVDVARLRTIESLQEEIASTDRAIEDRQKEIDDVSDAYSRDIERFEVLVEMVELRRSLLAQERKEREEMNTDPRR